MKTSLPAIAPTKPKPLKGNIPNLDINPHDLRPCIRRLSLSSRPLRSRISNGIPLSRDPPEFNRHPLLLIPLNLTQQRLPEIPVLNGIPRTRHPAILNPPLRPVRGTLHHILRIGSDD